MLVAKDQFLGAILISNFSNVFGLSCHSVLWLNFLENLPASVMCFPGMCAAEMK